VNKLHHKPLIICISFHLSKYTWKLTNSTGLQYQFERPFWARIVLSSRLTKLNAFIAHSSVIHTLTGISYTHVIPTMEDFNNLGEKKNCESSACYFCGEYLNGSSVPSLRRTSVHDKNETAYIFLLNI